jgi:RNA polymerase sigma factor (sigma-70 family)
MRDGDDPMETRPSLLLRIRDEADAASWSLFVGTYAPLIHRFARRGGLQDADAADLTQEVLAQVARSIRSFDYCAERGRFRDWLGTVTRRRIWEALARLRVGPRGAGEEAVAAEELAGPGPDPEWEDEFNAQVLRAAIEQIHAHFEPTTWRAFERAWVDDRPAGEVADELGVPVDAVYVAKSRVLKRLREQVLLLAEDLPRYVPLG